MTDVRMLTVYGAGGECVGFILARGRLGWEAFTAAQQSLGTYPTQHEAAAAIADTGVRS